MLPSTIHQIDLPERAAASCQACAPLIWHQLRPVGRGTEANRYASSGPCRDVQDRGAMTAPRYRTAECWGLQPWLSHDRSVVSDSICRTREYSRG
jgi:hypothetical protein